MGLYRIISGLFIGLSVFLAGVSTASAQVGRIDGCHTQAFGPRYGIQTHIRFEGWIREDAGAAQPYNFADRPWIWVTLRAPNRADQSFWFQPQDINLYRPDIRKAKRALTEWSGIAHTFVLPGAYIYPNTQVYLGVYKAGGSFEALQRSGLSCSHGFSN